MNQNNDGNESIAFIQILRGLAPIPVVFAHVPGLWLQETNSKWNIFDLYRQIFLHPLQLDNTGGKFGVIVFFLISGFVISLVAVKENRTEFLIKRIFRIFPALFAATIVAFITVRLSTAYGWGPIYSNTAVEGIDFLRSAFMLSWFSETPRAISVAWSLMPELIFYSFVLIAIGSLKKNPVKSTLILMGFYCLLTFPMAAVGYLSYFGYFTVYLPLFLIGRVFYLVFARQISTRQAAALFALNIVMFASIYNSRFPDDLFRPQYAGLFNIAVACALFFGLMVANPQRCPKPLEFLSKISYSFYLLHLSIGICVLNALASVDTAFGLKVFLAIGLSVVVATISFYAVERPAQRAARMILRRFG